MRVCQKSQVVRPEGAKAPSPGLGEIWAFSPHCLSFDTPSYCLWLIILLFMVNHIILYG